MNVFAKSMTILLLTGFIASCVSVDMPDHMVSDVVEAGKDAYKAIKEKLEKEEDQKAAENIYAALYVGDENTSIKEAKDHCIAKAVEKAKNKLNRQELTTEVVSEEVKAADKEFVVVCEVRVVN